MNRNDTWAPEAQDPAARTRRYLKELRRGTPDSLTREILAALQSLTQAAYERAESSQDDEEGGDWPAFLHLEGFDTRHDPLEKILGYFPGAMEFHFTLHAIRDSGGRVTCDLDHGLPLAGSQDKLQFQRTPRGLELIRKTTEILY